MSVAEIKDIEGIRVKLLARQKQIEVEIAAARSGSIETSAAVRTNADICEESQAQVEAEVSLQTAGMLSRELDDIIRALDRIRAGTYGFCRSCGTRIGLPRLNVLPFTPTCINCQQRREAGGPVRRRQTEGRYGHVVRRF